MVKVPNQSSNIEIVFEKRWLQKDLMFARYTNEQTKIRNLRVIFEALDGEWSTYDNNITCVP